MTLFLSGCSISNGSQSPSPSAQPLASFGKAISLGTFSFPPTPSPTPVGTMSSLCHHDQNQPMESGCNCTLHIVHCAGQPAQCTAFQDKTGKAPDNTFTCAAPGNGWCLAYDTQHIDGDYCLGKPVIYLYPTVDTVVSVKVSGSHITKSDPKYPENGWTVLAHPGGMLNYEDKKYSELYYESETSQKIAQPTSGVVLKAVNLGPSLKLLTMQLGLTASESDEFVLYWLPKLQSLNSPYILFSVLDSMTKDQIDHVQISPRPDTQIQFLAYFKPLQYPTQVAPLILPSRPVRQGFTSVEWGGTIDQAAIF